MGRRLLKANTTIRLPTSGSMLNSTKISRYQTELYDPANESDYSFDGEMDQEDADPTSPGEDLGGGGGLHMLNAFSKSVRSVFSHNPRTTPEPKPLAVISDISEDHADEMDKLKPDPYYDQM